MALVEDALLASLGIQSPNQQQQQQATQQQTNPAAPQATDALSGVPRYGMALPQPQQQQSGGVPGISGPGGVDLGNNAVRTAMSFKGMPYQWGGNGQGGIDCSGLVQQVYGRLGVHLPRTTYEQVNSGTPVGSLAEARPGDLIFLHNNGHVGIYAGNGQMIDANHTGGWVDVRPIAGYGQIAAIRRVM